MATKRNVDNSKGAHHHGPEHQCDGNNDFLSAAHINLMEEFIEFYKSKFSNQDNKLHHHSKKNLNIQKEASVDSYNFKGKLMLYFGNYLPAKVIDELCVLVRDNSYGKCSYCAMPTESLVLAVLQILVDAGSKICEKKDENAHVFVTKVTIPTKFDGDKARRVTHKFAEGNTTASMLIHTREIDKENSNQCMNKSPHTVTQIQAETKDTFDTLMAKLKNIVPVLDTPLVMNNSSCCRTEFVSQPEPINPMNKRIKLERPISHMCAPASALLGSHDPVNVVIDVDEIQSKDLKSHDNLHQNAKAPFDINVLGLNFNARSCDLAKISDQIYNRKNFPASEIKKNIDTRRVKAVGNEASNMRSKTSIQLKSSVRQPIVISPNSSPQCSAHATSQFHVTDEERHYYDIFCGLAQSQRKCFPAIKFLKTSVTFSSFGESVQPRGLVDNFFIAGCCRKFFEDHHPRRSKKHYFYPHVGGSLLTYRSEYDVKVVKNSFHGANSAHKLHLSEKLCFPVFEKNHWFVFIVDMKNKMFVFLDSYYDRADDFQTCVRDSLITSFKECWYEHADVKLDLENFSIQYPQVPKQENTHDCGIFTIKFMELWDNSLDMRQLFSQSDIPNIRIKLAMSLFFSKTNSANKSLVSKLYDEGINPRLCN